MLGNLHVRFGVGVGVKPPGPHHTVRNYIHNNPVRRGLVKRAVDWHWSSAGYYAGTGDSPISLDPIPWDWVYVDEA